MPDSDAHAIAGGAAGLVAIPASERLLGETSLLERLITISSSIMGARAPDLFEPADSPEHRGFFHSCIGGSLVVAATAKAVMELRKELETLESSFLWYRENGRLIPTEDLSWYRILRWILCFIVGFSYGYSSHLVLDGMTPRSLPLLGL